MADSLAQLESQRARPLNTEKTSAVLGKSEGSEAGAGTQPETNDSPPPGHGRNGAGAFVSSRKIAIAHPKLKHGNRCPECGKGNVYRQKDPKVLHLRKRKCANHKNQYKLISNRLAMMLPLPTQLPSWQAG